MNERRGRVLVTGGSGFIAGYCIRALLEDGWYVRATVRNAARAHDVRETLGGAAQDPKRLAFAAADLTHDAGWEEAADACDYVLHVASPFPSANPKNEAELITPARDGALRVLRAARDARVKRVVMTSSAAAVAYGHGGRDTPFTEDDWTDETNRRDTSAYERSKTIAERAAWDFMREEGAGMELVAINPTAVLGPVLGRDTSASIEIVRLLLSGQLVGCPRLYYSLVDVRDVADLHLRAMTNAAAAGQRFIAGGPVFSMLDVAKVLRERVPEYAGRVPKAEVPNIVMRLAGLVQPAVRARLFELDVKRPVSSAKAKRVLGWEARATEISIEDAARSLYEFGVLHADSEGEGKAPSEKRA